MYYTDVALPLPLRQAFTYEVNPAHRAKDPLPPPADSPAAAPCLYL